MEGVNFLRSMSLLCWHEVLRRESEIWMEENGLVTRGIEVWAEGLIVFTCTPVFIISQFSCALRL